MKQNDERKSFQEFLTETKSSFKIAIKDKKRWKICLIELFFVGLLIAIDLITKQFIYGYCVNNGKIDIIKGVFSFINVENTGASFGIFKNQTTTLTVLSLICAVILFIFIFYSYNRRNLWLRSSLILILAGALGNIIDRLALGYVRDFIYFELINFAVFNFADSCLTVGTIVLIVYMLFFYSKEEKMLEEKRKEQCKESDNSKKLSENNENEDFNQESQNNAPNDNFKNSTDNVDLNEFSENENENNVDSDK